MFPDVGSERMITFKCSVDCSQIGQNICFLISFYSVETTSYSEGLVGSCELDTEGNGRYPGCAGASIPG